MLTVSDKPEFAEKRRQIAARLAIPWWYWRYAVWDGELRKHLQRIADRLDSADTLDGTRGRLVSLADFDPNKLDLDLALSLSTRLDELLFECADQPYICSAVAAEFHRKDTTVTTWHDLYGNRPPDVLKALREDGMIEEAAVRSARRQLKALSHTRYEEYVVLRARQSMKSLFLVILACVLLILVVVFAWAIVRSSSLDWRDITLVGLSGAVGAVMSGTLKLRNTISHINDLRAFRPAMIVQPLLGVASAFVLLLALETRVLTVGLETSGWAVRGLLGFVAGFSEPFVLGIINSVIHIADRTADKRNDFERKENLD